MCVVDAEYEKVFGWTAHILKQEQRGPGGSIEDAAYQAQIKYGVPASILMRVHDRKPDNLLSKNWLRIKFAYELLCERAKRVEQHQEHLARETGHNETNSAFARGATLVAGAKDGAVKP